MMFFNANYIIQLVENFKVLLFRGQKYVFGIFPQPQLTSTGLCCMGCARNAQVGGQLLILTLEMKSVT